MKTAIVLNFPATHAEQITNWLRKRARRRARRIRKHGWRPCENDLAQLKASTRDAIAYRITARAWRAAGFRTVAIRRLAGRGQQPT